MNYNAEMVYASALKERHGFTDSLIKRLGAPDETAVNPKYRSAPPAKLYRLERALAFKAANPELFEKAALRRAAAKKSADTRWHALLDEVQDYEIELLRPLPKQLSELETVTRNHAEERYGSGAQVPGKRAIFATVRHEYTNYEDLLQKIKGKIGVKEAYESIRFDLDREIKALLMEAYPEENWDLDHKSPLAE
jgi:hypothetical protein